jgi:hypothetical protein
MRGFDDWLRDLGIGGRTGAFDPPDPKDVNRGNPRYKTAFAFLDLGNYARQLIEHLQTLKWNRSRK